MKKITKILILLTIPNQFYIVYGLVIQGAPFCYGGYPPFDGAYSVPSIRVYQCYWGLDTFFRSDLVYSLIVTVPIMLVAFFIHYIKNRKTEIR